MRGTFAVAPLFAFVLFIIFVVGVRLDDRLGSTTGPGRLRFL